MLKQFNQLFVGRLFGTVKRKMDENTTVNKLVTITQIQVALFSFFALLHLLD